MPAFLPGFNLLIYPPCEDAPNTIFVEIVDTLNGDDGGRIAIVVDVTQSSPVTPPIVCHPMTGFRLVAAAQTEGYSCKQDISNWVVRHTQRILSAHSV